MHLFTKSSDIHLLHAFSVGMHVRIQRGDSGYRQGSHRLEKYLNIQDWLEKSLKIKFALL